MADDDAREFPNQNPDFNETLAVLQDGEIKPVIKENLRFYVSKFLKILENNLAIERYEDNSVYTGTAGIAYLYLSLSRILNNDGLLNISKNYCDSSMRSLKKHRVSFLCGDAGPLAIAAVVYKRLNRESESRDFVSKLEALHDLVVPLESDLPDELLYGRAGYLYALLFVQRHLGKTAIRDDITRKVVESIIVSGQRLSLTENNKNCPLFYKWHGKPYVGAAHGIVGILYILLLAEEYLSRSQLENLILPTMEFLLLLKFKSGNFPSSLGNSSDKLIHWCHGAPGAVHLFAKAYQVFGDERYLELARECCRVIWSRGLLKKGYGICHGVAGNGYAFLCLYRLTKEESYLYQAIKFCEWCYDYGNHGCRVADRPLSLFEGLAGTIYFMADTLDPNSSLFPAFSL